MVEAASLNRQAQNLEIRRIDTVGDFPDWLSQDELAAFLHESLKPYEDTPPDIRKGLNYALSEKPGEGGFVLAGRVDGRLAASLVMLKTGMSGYIPENILLFVAVSPDSRGKGLGRQIIERAITECEGSVKLHVEYDNPAKRLYERIGFTSKYAEMRFNR
jgi:ribosomal-protein-alanine N-acetyltransferase